MAKLFLESTDATYTVSTGKTEVHGANGSQVVTVATGATGVTFDANVEGVSFAGATSDYQYKIIDRSSLGVYKGTDLVATVAVQDDSATALAADVGTVLSFSNGSVAAQLTVANGTLTGLTLGGAAVTTTQAAVTPTTFLSTTGNGSTSTGVAGQTFTLTTGVDNITGTTGNDSIIADNSTAAVITSVADNLNGGAGDDTLTIYGFNHTTDGVPQISNIETVVLSNSAAGSTISLVNATGLTSVIVKDAAGATDTTVPVGTTVTLLSNDDATTAQVVDFGATATSAKLILNDVLTNTTKDVEAQGALVTVLNLSTTGAASTVGQLEVDSAMATVNISGDKNLTVTDAIEEAVEIINASTFTGNLKISLADQATAPDAAVAGVDVNDISITGGTGNDIIDVSAEDDDVEIFVNAGAGNDKVVYVDTATNVLTAATSTNAGDSINGGEGTDIFSVNGDLTADLTGIVSGFETLEFTGDAAGTNMSTNKLGITNFLTTGTGIDVVLTGLGANSTITSTDATSGDITATIATDTTTDVLNIVMESAGSAAGSAITLNNYDTLNLSSTKSSTDAATVSSTVTSIAATSVGTLNISGTQDLTITTAGLKAAANVVSTSTGAVTSTYTTSINSYAGGTGVDTLNLVAGNLAQGKTFAGGTGSDVLSVTTSSNQDLGILGLTGFERLNLTLSGANVADLRNVTDLTKLYVTAAANTNDLTLNRLSSDTTVYFTASIDQVVTTVALGTTQKVAVSTASTITSLTLDSGTTALVITSDDDDANAAESMSNFTAISGTSLAAITVLGADDTTLNTLSTTVTSVNASGATGNLSVTASATATSIIGSQVADGITGGAAIDTIQGGKGADVLSGAAGADIYVFESTGALNGSDTLTIVPGAGGDVLNFKNFLSGGSIDQNGGIGTAITAYTTASTSDVAITNKVALYSDATEGNIDTTTEIAALIQGSSDAFSLASGGKAILLTGDASGANDILQVWFVDDTLDGVSGTVSATDIVLVGTDSDTTYDLDTLITSNFAFA